MRRFGIPVFLACALLPGLAVAEGAGMAPSAAAAQGGAESGYHLVKTIPLPGDKGWDYCLADSVGRRLYVTHGDRVLVLDLDNDTLVGAIGPFLGIHGVALARAFGRGYVSLMD